MAFERIVVLGPGLLGGSVGLAVKERSLGEVVFWGRSEKRLGVVREAGFEASDNLEDATRDADLVIMATPVDYYHDLALRLAAGNGKKGLLVTDVGSVKGFVHQSVGDVLGGAGIAFIGSHPMAGSDRTGFAHASSELFEGSCCFLTDDEGVGGDQLASLRAFWSSLGCCLQETTAQRHDEIVARVSHLPHVLAAVGARVGLRCEGESRFGGGGLRDTTRVAGGDPAMWRGILLENRKAVISELQESIEDLRQLVSALEQEEADDVEQWLAVGQERRRELDS
ncbi:MAG: prephenate dehydrogenase/arogenate dehydrogenase family protein [Verrucomicrobiota bacterium JB023]|nr:prephenate dehydrogenase/arogenate dehydrogenase family protein [Verrucomicrobiota bacterium JB023]